MDYTDKQNPIRAIREIRGQNRRRGEMSEKFFGKYRAVVINNRDPEQRGRLQVRVPDVSGDVVINWAMPCVPYNLPKKIGSSLPKPGAGVWIEFEQGDLNQPVWTGFFWSADDIPPSLRNK